MENNQMNTINLGNNIAGATPPVYSNGNTRQVLNTEVQNNLQQEPLNTSSNNNVVPEAPKIIAGDIEIPTSLLRSIVAQARKVGVYDNLHPVSCVLNLIIDENGITVRTTSGIGKQDFECVDKQYVFNNKLSTSVDIKLLGEYLNAEKSDMIKLKVDNTDGMSVLHITNGKGIRKFAQRIDESTGQVIVNTLHFPMKYEDMRVVNYSRLRDLLDLNSSARDLADKASYNYLKGMYCGDDIIVSSDGNIMIIQPNELEFNDKIFFLNNDICKLIKDIKFDTEKFRIGITDENGFPAGITMSDGRITICGHIGLEDKFPVEFSRNLWKSNSFNYKVTIKTKEFYNILKSMMPFVPNIGDNIDKIAITVSDSVMNLKCLDGSAEDTINITNVTNLVTPKPIVLPISKLEKLIQTIKADNFDLLVDMQSDNCVCLGYDGIKSVVTTL